MKRITMLGLLVSGILFCRGAAAQLTMEENTDRFGQDYAKLPAADAQACRQACSDAGAKCQAYAFYKPKSDCYLKSSAAEATANKDISSGVRVEPLTMEEGTDRFGQDYAKLPAADAQACRKACADAGPKCQAYAFYKPASDCYLKTSAAGATANKDIISGVRAKTLAAGQGKRKGKKVSPPKP